MVLALCGLALAAHAYSYSFVSDDAYISMRYSYNLAHHGELTFNLGERVEGYTNFLWTVLLAGAIKVGLNPELASQLFGWFFGALALVFVYRITRLLRDGAPPSGWDYVAVCMLPTWGCFAVWCSGGLETQMFCALMLAGLARYLAETADPGRRPWSGVLFALSAMTRPEGMLIFGLVGLHRLAVNIVAERRYLPTVRQMIWGLGFLLPFGVFMAWRYSYYGDLLPNTFYVKAGSGAAMAKKWGLPYLWDFVHFNRIYVLLPLLFLLPWRSKVSVAQEPRRSSHTVVFSLLLPIVLIYTAYVTWVGGDFMAMSRFFVPVMPLIAILAQEGLRRLVAARDAQGQATTVSARPRLRLALVVVPLLAGGCLNSYGLHRQSQKMSYYRWGLDTVAYLRKFADDRIIIGRWMREQLPSDTYYSVGGAGASVYASRLRALDAFGLNDHWIAHNGPRVGDRPGHGKMAPEHYILKKKPDLLCHMAKHQDTVYFPPPHEAAYWQARGYRWACMNPPGLRPRYYCCLRRVDRDLGTQLVEASP